MILQGKTFVTQYQRGQGNNTKNSWPWLQGRCLASGNSNLKEQDIQRFVCSQTPLLLFTQQNLPPQTCYLSLKDLWCFRHTRLLPLINKGKLKDVDLKKKNKKQTLAKSGNLLSLCTSDAGFKSEAILQSSRAQETAEKFQLYTEVMAVIYLHQCLVAEEFLVTCQFSSDSRSSFQSGSFPCKSLCLK